jgi:hypothetical protein
VKRNRQRFAGLPLSHCNLVAIDVLPTHAGHVTDALPGVKQQNEPIWP